MLGERQDVSGLVCEECKRFTELKGNLPNSIKNKIELLKGNFISLEISDNISKKQIQVLKKKLDELITDIIEKFDDDLPFADYDSPYKNDDKSKNIKKHDDLPF